MGSVWETAVIDSMLEAAPQPPKSEPVAFIEHHKGGDNLVWDNPGGEYSALYTAPPAPSLPDGWRSAIAKEFPLYDEDGLDEGKHCCEWVMLQERKRLHKILAAPTPAEPPADVARDATRYRQQRDKLLAALEGLLLITADSKGVAGYHPNGAVANWDEFPEVNEAALLVTQLKGQS